MSEVKHTPGPWQWDRRENGEWSLIHPQRGWLLVMDFVRHGMQKGQPRFATWKGDERENMGGIMVPAAKLDLPAHPDARLIAAAPELLAACEAALAYIPGSEVRSWPPGHDLKVDALAKLRASIGQIRRRPVMSPDPYETAAEPLHEHAERCAASVVTCPHCGEITSSARTGETRCMVCGGIIDPDDAEPTDLEAPDVLYAPESGGEAGE